MNEENKTNKIGYTVYPSEELSVFDSDEFKNSDNLRIDNGTSGHSYLLKQCKGFSNGQTQYIDKWVGINFVEKLQNGTIIPGLQSEQLVLALIDRHIKLNERFPSPFNEKGIKGLKMFLEAQKERIDDRIARNVMGELKL